MPRSFWILCALGGLGLACSEAPGAEALGSAEDAIVNGEVSDEKDDAVVRVLVPAEQTSCSGTLVAPNLVATALHCVAAGYNASGVFSCDKEGVLNTSSPPDGEFGGTVAAADIEVHLGAAPDNVADAYGARVFGSGSQVICRNDIAFIVLDRELDSPLAPLRRERKTVRNEVMRVVGYGQTEMPVSSGRHRRDGVLVTAVGSLGTAPASGMAAPNTFVLGPGACQGDSGGPALDQETGALTGVYSLSAGISCTYAQIRNVYTNVEAFSSLIDRAFAFAGHTPVAEPGDGSGAGGESSGGGAGETGSSGAANGGSGGSPGSGGTDVGSGGSETSGGSPTQGGSRSSGGAIGEGSGSRRASSCALKGRPGAISGSAGAVAAIALMGVMALRRRRR